MAESALIDAALVATLQNDATLAALLPDGIWLHEAPPQVQSFGLVSIILAEDEAVFGQRAVESIRYLVKAVTFGAGHEAADAAAARIDVLLEDQPLTVTGYGWMTCYREERIGYADVDDADPELRWQHRGGHYRVQMATA